MVRISKQGTGVGAGIGVRTLGRGQQFPGGTGLFTLLPLYVTGKQIEGIYLLWVRVRTGL